MTKLTNTITTTYKIKTHYRLDVVTEEFTNFHEAWLYKVNYGIKWHMFGCETKTIEEFLDLVKGNVDEYIEFYREEVEHE